MKILVCVDGSAQSLKGAAKAVEIASGCGVNEVALIYVYETAYNSYWTIHGVGFSTTRQDLEMIRVLDQRLMSQRKKLLLDAASLFQNQLIEPELIIKEGHPAHTIASVADENGFDLIVMGSRGSGGLKKRIPGSVSNAVIQETRASVLIVK
jgi:nucleotide-binding universal stress UspA family protein